jgi:hypothetical protein
VPRAPRRHVTRVLLPLMAAIVLSGCASTRMASIGMLSNGEALVTLVVSERRGVVERECQGVHALGPLLGCHLSRAIPLPNGGAVRAVKIVRYTDALPSPMAFDIDVHELCHAIASLQAIGDPCHAQDGGRIRSSASRRSWKR